MFCEDPDCLELAALQKRTIEELLIGQDPPANKTIKPEFLRLAPPLFLRLGFWEEKGRGARRKERFFYCSLSTAAVNLFISFLNSFIYNKKT